MASHSTGQFVPDTTPESVKHRAVIWKTFWIMFGITAVEFAIAFAKGPYHFPHTLVVVVFVCLTLWKAFYIVAEFMHLRHEVKMLILAVVLPLLFIVWFIVSMLYEGNSVFLSR